jgi:hypothetical protein
MKKGDKARYFGISLTTLANWKRQGCPVDGDLPAIAEWKAARELELAGVVGSGLPALVREHTRRRVDLGRRIELVNAWHPGTEKKPNLIKAATVSSLILEQTLLDLPRRLLAAGPEAAPESIYSVIFDALDEARGEKEGEPINPSRST